MTSWMPSLNLIMAALTALPWRTTRPRVALFYSSFNHVDRASKILPRSVHTESGENLNKESTIRSKNLSKKLLKKLAEKERGEELMEKGSIQTWDGRQRMMSLAINHHSNTPDATFFAYCEKLRTNKHTWETKWLKSSLKSTSRLTLFILFTPGFTSWFNDDTFIPEILKRISHPSKGRLEYNVIYACVDGIAPNAYHDNFHGQPVTQGFSMLQTRKRRPWSKKEYKEGEEFRPAITFDFQDIPSRVTVPVANTLFHTGRPSELVWSRWEAKDGTFIEVKERTQQSLVYIFNPSFTCAPSFINTPLSSFIPARPITPFKKIEAGLGNIIRTLDFGDGHIGPASRELETAVSSISERLGGATVDVWALIVPPDVFSAESENLPEAGPEYVGFWMNRGATLCRVVSGGGGWGPKQGLLSLDPETYINYQKESGLEDKYPDEQTVSSLGNLAQIGASIQFLVVDKNLPIPLRSSNNIQPPSPEHSMVFGAIPSTIDDLPQGDNHEAGKVQYHYRQGHFGCVSGSGIYYRYSSTQKKALQESAASENLGVSESLGQKDTENNPQSDPAMVWTKINLPYSYVYAGKLSKEPQQEVKIRKYDSNNHSSSYHKFKTQPPQQEENSEQEFKIRKHVSEKRSLGYRELEVQRPQQEENSQAEAPEA